MVTFAPAGMSLAGVFVSGAAVSMLPVRIAFADAVPGALRLDHAGLSYQGSRQVLSFTGWHADGTPFATVTAPFDGSPVARAIQAAHDIIATHTGSASLSLGLGRAAGGGSAQVFSTRAEPLPIQAIRTTVMSQKGSGLARLVGGLRDFDSKADALATRLEQAMTRMETALPTTEAIVGNVEKGAADLEAVNSQYSNGPATGNSSGNSGG